MIEDSVDSTSHNGENVDMGDVVSLPSTPGTTSSTSNPPGRVSSPSQPVSLSRGSGQEKSLLAVRAFHSPGTSEHFLTKKDAAASYGASPPLFAKYEKEMRQTGVLSSVLDGTIPAPDLPMDSFHLIQLRKVWRKSKCCWSPAAPDLVTAPGMASMALLVLAFNVSRRTIIVLSFSSLSSLSDFKKPASLHLFK
eukprot:scpid31633/ scgid18983/ 